MAIEAQFSAGFVFGNCQDLLTENACGLNNIAFNLQHHHQQQQQQQANSKAQEFMMQRSTKIVDDYPSSSIAQVVSAQIENQRIEIDHYINSQNERLRSFLHEQRRQQTSMLMKRCGSKIQSLIKQKDEEILRAARKNAELQECVRKMEMERLTWQRVSQEREAMAESLSGTIQRLREAAAEDAGSCCCGGEAETAEVRRQKEVVAMVCRCCNARESCVIMLPCRHLCSCRDCDAFLDCCPVCNAPKKSTLEALL